jgi:hypothetical protein
MKKAEKIELAVKCYKTIKELGLKVETYGPWLKLSPPKKIPVDLTTDLLKCKEYVIELIENERINK